MDRFNKLKSNMGHDVGYIQADAPRFERVIWYREPHLRKLYFMSLFLLIASATTGYDGMLVNTSQQMNKWKEYFPEQEDANKLGILINMYNIGSICSFFIVPYMADKLGRKPTIMIGCLIMIAGAMVSAFCNGYAMYMIGRYVLGFGNSMAQMCSPMLLTEICHPQHRGPLTTVYNCLWNFGSLIVSVVGWGTSYLRNDWSWRSITFIQAVPSVVQLCGIWFIPESPRFLVNKDKSEEALQVLAKHHGGGNINNSTVQFQYREIKETIQADRNAGKSTSYMDFVRTKGNRWRLAIIVSLGIISQYSGNALFSNYMDIIYEGAGITAEGNKLALSAGKTIMDLAISIAAAFSVDKVGRRPLFLVAISGMVVAFALWTLVGGIYENSAYQYIDEEGKEKTGYSDTKAGYAQIAFVWLFGIFYDIGFSGLLVAYALEILPFHLRAKGMMIMNIVVQAILAIGNQTNKVAWVKLPNHWNLMLFYTIWDLVELVFVYCVYVETKGPTLEEIARIFDGEDAVIHIDLQQVEKEAQIAHHDEWSAREGHHKGWATSGRQHEEWPSRERQHGDWAAHERHMERW